MIELKNICKDYISGDNVVHALKNINLAFRENEFVAILGPSGGGKTTLLNIIGGLDHYSSGDLIINGKSTANFKDRDWDSYRNHSIGFVFQSYNLIPHQSVLSNVELALTISGVSKSERTERAKKALDNVGLSDQYYKKPNQLSGGQMQRVAIARALVNDPDILLADEPTGALDTESSVQIMDLLKEVAADRLVIMVTHNPELAQQYANRIVRIRDGKINDDTNPISDDEKNTQPFVTGKTSMSFLTSLALSLNNLMTKKGRTILTAFAGSIGIIGIALILALSHGVNNYIADVQRDSLSSYPLTIQNTTADMTGLMTSMMGTLEAIETNENTITEVQIVQDIFNNIGSNNLKGFNNYMKEHYSEIDQYLTDIQYSYGINLYIYSSDTSKGPVQLNPSNSSGVSTISLSNTFQQMISNQDMLDKQFDVLVGKWPEKYDEVVMIVSNPNAISDYMAYSLGFRDPKEFRELMTSAYKGEEINIHNEPLSWSYDDLMNLTFKLVLPADYYTYDSTYNVWTNNRDDEAFVTKLIENGLELKVVGLVTPNDSSASTAMRDGIGYREELVKYVIEESGKKEIVKQQLADKDLNVISGKPFDEPDDEKETLNFEDMITIDQDMLKNAFGSKLDPKKLQNDITNYITEALSNITADTSKAQADLTNGFITITVSMLNDYIEENGMMGNAMLKAEDIEPMVAAAMEKEYATALFTQLSAEYVVPEATFIQIYTPMVGGVMQGYYQLFTASSGMDTAILNSEAVEAMVAGFASSEELQSGFKSLAITLTEAKSKTAVGTIMGTMSGDVIQQMGSAFKVDTDAFAKAFKFNLDEDELNRVLSSYMSGDSAIRDQDYNLRLFGYADLDNPSTISFYFRDFDSKDDFKSWLKDYNNMVGEADSITYTDITGILMSSVSNIVNAVSYVLIAFVSVSLIVSSIMIGIITYISVLERTKEIGVLRSLGTSKHDVGKIFNAETFIIGLFSGAIGIGVTLLLCIPINIIIRKLTNISNISAVLPTNNAIVLVIISVTLTIIAGLIPARMASKKDPVTALRTE